MPSSIRIQLNKPGIKAFAKSDAMQQVMDHFANEIAQGAGDGFVVSSRTGRNRARAVVIAASAEANRAEKKKRVLTRAVQAARTR